MTESSVSRFNAVALAASTLEPAPMTIGLRTMVLPLSVKTPPEPSSMAANDSPPFNVTGVTTRNTLALSSK